MTHLFGVGTVRARHLLSRYLSLEEFFSESAESVAAKTEFTRGFVESMQRSEALEIASKIVEYLEAHSIDTVFCTSPRFPRRLNTCPDAPLLLYSKGNFDYNAMRTVSVVGTRSATPYGEALCRELIASFQDQDITVISGLALGIDACAHRACLEFNVPTIGVLGHGLDRIYPYTHRELASRMLAQGGLVTEFIPGTNPDRENFPMRNRIVAGLSDALIVVESKVSGGSLITAQLANDYNRDVFAFPGSVQRSTSQGCNALIARQQAHLLESPGAFLEFMGWKAEERTRKPQRAIFQNLSGSQQRIVEVLSQSPGIQIDTLSLKTSMPITALHVDLFQLEMDGVVRSLPGKSYTMA
jgi:DNA processing protein